jgi:hypothetical protein
MPSSSVPGRRFEAVADVLAQRGGCNDASEAVGEAGRQPPDGGKRRRDVSLQESLDWGGRDSHPDGGAVFDALEAGYRPGGRNQR